MKLTDRNFGLPIFTLVTGAFLVVGAQRLGEVPVPDSGDESMILQVPYEVLNRGLFAWPMYRYLGGGIENVWHSFRPVYYWLMTGFFKLFGWGLTQGRAFNLIAATLLLGVVFLIGRRFFDWRVGLAAVVMLVSDNTFVERSRMVRNEYLATMFALLAFYLFEAAERRKRGWLYAVSGVAAGAGVMTHTNILYIVGAIMLLMLLKHGWRVLKSRSPYQFMVGAFVVMAYEIVYDIIDYQNVRLQYHGDRAHFARISSSGFWQNLLDEPARYRDWFAGSLLFPDVPRTLQHLFQGLTVVALSYLVIVCVRGFRRDRIVDDPQLRVLVVTVVAMVFLAIVTGSKRKYSIYMVYLSPWFALCVGVLLRASFELISRLKSARPPTAERFYRPAVAAVLLAVFGYGSLVARQEFRLVSAFNAPHLASFEEFADVLRSIVPEGVCPASVERPALWLAFPEFDRCYASIERRMAENIDIDGRDYALIIPTRKNPAYIKDPDQNYTLLGAMDDTPYGNLRVYYTGANPSYRALAPMRYHFFDKWRGHVSDEQLAAAREIWSADSVELRAAARSTEHTVTVDGLTIEPPQNGAATQTDLGSVELKPNTAYQVIVDASSLEGGWQLAIIDAETGDWIARLPMSDESGVQPNEKLFMKVFRTFGGARVNVAAVAVKQGMAAPLSVAGVRIREVASLAAQKA